MEIGIGRRSRQPAVSSSLSPVAPTDGVAEIVSFATGSRSGAGDTLLILLSAAACSVLTGAGWLELCDQCSGPTSEDNHQGLGQRPPADRTRGRLFSATLPVGRGRSANFGQQDWPKARRYPGSKSETSRLAQVEASWVLSQIGHDVGRA